MKKLKLLIVERNITQQVLAEELGVHAVTVSNWCRGYTEPSKGMKLAICQVLNVELNQIEDESRG